MVDRYCSIDKQFQAGSKPHSHLRSTDDTEVNRPPRPADMPSPVLLLRGITQCNYGSAAFIDSERAVLGSLNGGVRHAT